MKNIKSLFLISILILVIGCFFNLTSVSAAETVETTTSAETTSEPVTEEPTTANPYYINPSIYKKSSSGVYVTKSRKAYDNTLKKSIYTLKAGIRYNKTYAGTNGYSVIEISSSKKVFVKTIYLTQKSTAKYFVNKNDKKYSYYNMVSDIKQLCKSYGTVLKKKTIGTTLDKRPIYAIELGNPNATRVLYVETSIHAREWLNTQVIMSFVENYCRGYDTSKYGKTKYSTILNKIRICIIPMVNPDGVTISQYGYKKIRSSSLRKKIKKIGKGVYKTWKANARGVDLNRNFSPGFGYKSAKKASASGYSGKKALSEPEAKAVANYVTSLNPKAALCYHEAGEVLYYTKNTKLLRLVHSLTKYTLINDYDKNHYGSFGDFLDAAKIPNCTPETCIPPAPVSHKQFNKVYNTNKNVIIASAKLYMK